MIWINNLYGKKYGVVQTVSVISHDFLFLTMKLNCSDRFSSKKDISKAVRVSQNLQSLNKFTEGNTRKSTVNFAFSSYADVIKQKENLCFHLCTRRLLKLASSARAWS